MRDERKLFYEKALNDNKGDFAKEVGWMSEKSVTYRFNLIKKLIGDFSDKIILDHGCGTLNLYKFIKDENYAYYLGVDENLFALKYASDKYNIPIYKDVQELYNPKEKEFMFYDPGLRVISNLKFDIITAIGYLQDFDTQREISYHIETLYKMLNPGGKLIITTLSNRNIPDGEKEVTLRMSPLDIVSIMEYNGYKYELNMHDLGDQIILVIYK